MLDGMSDSIQGSRIENLHSREVDRQSPTGLIFCNVFNLKWTAIRLHFDRATTIRWPASRLGATLRTK